MNLCDTFIGLFAALDKNTHIRYVALKFENSSILCIKCLF
jgi:hypothetical protein